MIAFEDAQVVINVYRKAYKKRLEPYKAGESNSEIAHCNNVLNMLNQIEKFLKLLDDLDNLQYIDNQSLAKHVLKLINNTHIDAHITHDLIKEWSSEENENII